MQLYTPYRDIDVGHSLIRAITNLRGRAREREISVREVLDATSTAAVLHRERFTSPTEPRGGTGEEEGEGSRNFWYKCQRDYGDINEFNINERGEDNFAEPQ